MTLAARPDFGPRSLGIVAVAIGVASAAGYLLLLLCGRVLAPADYAVFLTFWGFVFGVGSALSPVEQEVGRLSALARAEGRRTPAAALQVLVVSLLLGAVACLPLATPAVRSALFGSHAGLAPLAALSAIAFVGIFGVRGVLVGHGALRPYASLVVADAIARLLLIALFVAVGSRSVLALSLAVAGGCAAWVGFLPSARPLMDLRSPREPWGPVARRMVALVLAAGLSALVITGYPALVAVLTPGRPDVELGALFAALTVSRIPLLAVAPLQALAIPHIVATLATAGGVARVRRFVVVGGTVAVFFAALGGVTGGLVGRRLVRLLYGGTYAVSSRNVAALVASAVVLAGVLLGCAVLVAIRRYGGVSLVWATVAGLAVLVLIATPGSASTRAVHGLLLGPSTGLLLTVLLCLRALSGSADGPASPDVLAAPA